MKTQKVTFLKNQKKIPSKENYLKTLPETPGVYIFTDKSYQPIYIGKAINIKSRVSSYFSRSAIGKSKEIPKQAIFIIYIPTTGEFEALILESDLIKTYKPKYNVSLKDDKSPLYIRITNDKYKRVLSARKSDLEKSDTSQFGPFPSSTQVTQILKMLRRIFPYSTHLPYKNPCLYHQLNLCNPCPSLIESTKDVNEKKILEYLYKDNIRNVKGLLTGRFTWVINRLETKMADYSKKQEYEKANDTKTQIDNIRYITQERFSSYEFLNNPNFVEDVRTDEIKETISILKDIGINIEKLVRIECYDVAHIAGSYTTASMVTFFKGEPDKNYYRHFRVRSQKKPNDVGALKEIISRRVGHFNDWGTPDLIVVDGGKGQVKVFYEQLRDHGIPVVGLAKRHESVISIKEENEVLQFKEKRLPRGNAKNLFQRLRNEAHRFARRYHHHLLKKDLLGINN